MRNNLYISTKGSKPGVRHTCGTCITEEDQAQVFFSGLQVASGLKEKP